MPSSSELALIIVDVQRAFDEWEAKGKRRNNPKPWRGSPICSPRSASARADLPHPP